MNWAEQLAAVKATKKAKIDAKKSIVNKAFVEKRSTSDDENQSIVDIDADIKKLDDHAKMLNGFIADEAHANSTATPAAGQSFQGAAKSAQGDPAPDDESQRVAVTQNLDKGVGFAKAMRARVTAQLERRNGSNVTALEIAKSRHEPEQVIRYLEKDALIGSTNVPEMAALSDSENLASEFIDLLRNRTVFDKLKGFREVPFNTKMANQLTGGLAGWVGEGNAKPVTNATFGSVKIDEHKLAAIAIFTDEFLRNSKPKADAIFLEDLIVACAELIDSTFLSADAGTDDKPAGILNAVTGIVGTGMSADQTEADLQLLISEFLINNKSLAGAQVVMSEVRANQFARMRDALGSKYHTGMQGGINEKALDGIEVIESEAAGNKLIMLKPSEILLADDGAVEVAYSNEATIINGTQTINLWQQNMSAVRVERFISWAKRRTTAVSFIQYT